MIAGYSNVYGTYTAFTTIPSLAYWASILVRFADTEDTGTEQNTELSEVGVISSIGFTWGAGRTGEMKVTYREAAKDFPGMFECKVIEFIRYVRVHHHFEGDFAYGLPRALADSVLSLMAWRCKGPFDTVYFHKGGHFTGKIGLRGVSAQSHDPM